MESYNVTIKKINEVYLVVNAERSILYELNDYFTFLVPNYTFMPSYRNKMWDGKIRLFNINNHRIYYGLLNYIIKFCETEGYTYFIDGDVVVDKKITEKDFFEWTLELKIPFSIRPYQLESAFHCINKEKTLLLSPTGSGKSLIIYLICRFFGDKKILITVPTISLVTQMYEDFKDYSINDDEWDALENCHMIYAGMDKVSPKNIIISTWQSIHTLGIEYFDGYDVVIGDEAHLYKSKSLTNIMTNLVNAKYRIGTTGTLDGMQTHKLILEGLFGKIKKIVTTEDLMKSKHLSTLKIKCTILRYSSKEIKDVSGMKYKEELDFIVSHNGRNEFIKNLASNLKKNTLILFQLVEKHGEVLYNIISDELIDKKVFFVHGGTDPEDREYIRKYTETHDNVVIIASFGVYSTGINIKNLHNIIFSSPTKSKVRNLQSIGRGLRLHDNKSSAILYDIVDDLSTPSRDNYTLKHFRERVKIYDEEKFDYELYNINLFKDIFNG